MTPMMPHTQREYCIGCGELTQKGSRRLISDSTDILSLWKKKIGRDKGQEEDRFMCRKCFNSYVKVKKELEVSSQSFNSYLVATSLHRI